MKIKQFLFLVIFILVITMGMSSCEKAPELTMTGPGTIEANADGSSATITFTANRDWSVVASDSWLSISPSSGKASDAPITVTVRCYANTSYDPRSTTVIIRMEEMEQSVYVKQAAKLGIEVPTKYFDIASEARTIDVEVQANVQYSVSVSENWIRQTGTKALESHTLTFSIDENTSYDARSATITVKSENAAVQNQVVNVKQAQMDALIVDKTSYDMPYGGGEIEVKVDANVSFDVKPSSDWISYVSTKALTTSTVKLSVSENNTYYPREGTVVIAQKNGKLSYTLTIKQDARIPVTSIELDKSFLSFVVDNEAVLKAIVKPDNATDKAVSWSSSDKSVVTVDQDGKLKAVSKGHAVITAKCSSFTASCKVFVKAADYPVPAGAVDLGLSVVWASRNLGASSPTASGNFYLWGDPAGDGVIMFFNAPNMNSIYGTQYDVAVAQSGKGWRLPTRNEISELLSSCSWENVSGGVRLTGPNGNSIVLPLTGMAFPADGAIGTTKLTSTDKGYMMTGESYADASGRFVYVYHYNQGRSYNWVSYNAPMAKFPVRPVFESMDGAIHVVSVSLNKTEITLTEGESETLEAAVKPDDATDKSVCWSSSDSGIVTVENGKLTALKVGTATITVTSTDCGKTASCKVTVKAKTIPVSSVTLDKTSISLIEGNKETLVATVAPGDATDKKVSWSSDNTAVATVKDGVVTAVKAGSAKITVTTAEGSKTASCVVTVSAPNVSLKADSFVVPYSGGQVALEITSNIEYGIKSDCGWITVDGKTLTIAANASDKERKGTVTISNSTYKLTRTVTITQDAYPNGLDDGGSIVLP